ncbi:MAG TPA: glycosyltransferase family 4 protein [Rhizomicrobium sp.]|jgi:glycosyltransferase involved in cell wall biosynthesis
MNQNRPAVAKGPAVLQIVPTLNSGGAERSTIEIAAALAREGFTPLVASEGGRMVGELEAAGGEWISMPANAKSPLALLANARRIVELIRTRNIALVHARSRAPAWSALWATRRTGTPFVTTWHGAHSAESAPKRYYNSVMLRGDAVIANSQWTADHIRSTYSYQPKKLITVPRGVDLTAFDPAGTAPSRVDALRRDWHVRDGEIVILFPGRLSRRKGQLVLIDALAQLVRDFPYLRAVLAGDAQRRDDYAAEIGRAVERNGLATHVTIAGHVQDMPAAYLAADIVVSATIEPEAFGRVAAEAAALERPVIATDHGGAREIILPGQSGFLVHPGDAGALTEALRELLVMGPVGRVQMGARGRARIRDRFTLDRMTADTIALYRELLG